VRRWCVCRRAQCGLTLSVGQPAPRRTWRSSSLRRKDLLMAPRRILRVRPPGRPRRAWVRTAPLAQPVPGFASVGPRPRRSRVRGRAGSECWGGHVGNLFGVRGSQRTTSTDGRPCGRRWQKVLDALANLLVTRSCQRTRLEHFARRPYAQVILPVTCRRACEPPAIVRAREGGHIPATMRAISTQCLRLPNPPVGRMDVITGITSQVRPVE
jgi:hypothetical protein